MRLIDADDLIVVGLDAPDCKHQLKFVPLEFIENAETVDAVPVVRCGGCRYNYGLANQCEYNEHDIVCTFWASDGLDKADYCSNGRRLDDE